VYSQSSIVFHIRLSFSTCNLKRFTKFFRVYPDSTLRYSSRMNFDVACAMDFHRFPVDKQICEINFESFGHTSKQLTFNWRKDLSTVNPNITLAQFVLDVLLEDTYATDYYDLSYPGKSLICIQTTPQRSKIFQTLSREQNHRDKPLDSAEYQTIN